MADRAALAFIIPINRWSIQQGAELDAKGRLLYRSNLPGSDLPVTNFGGGNTSAKLRERDPLTGETVDVLHVKGSGGDLTVVSDWGTSYLIAKELGPKAFCLVDLSHQAPNVNIEQIVARLQAFGRLGGFHFNDSKYGDDDLDSGLINPHQLFLMFNELRDAYSSEVRLIVAMARYEAGGTIDPIAAFRESGWRRDKASVRKSTSLAAGIVS